LKSVKNEILNEIKIAKSIIRLSHEIIEKNNSTDEIYLVGILTRGKTLAERIHKNLTNITDNNVSNGTIDITFHRDDYLNRLKTPKLNGTNIDESIDEKTVILVDDVLYTGRTIRAAIDALMSFGRPKSIQLAVLVDRGHRELPIRADYVGKNIPTHEGEHVEVLFKEIDSQDSVRLIRNEIEK
tara:strand:- start:425 stop:976 length:552 start_codon:yes stop_codon:yes gene_type:complete